jgi:hypothetical protein
LNSDFSSYIDRLGLIAFFAGYPVIYSIVLVMNGEHRPFVKKLVVLLPYGYALTGTLFLGFIAREFYADPLKKFASLFENSYLEIWGLLAVLFWIPAFSKKTLYSLLHSLVFFLLLLKDFFQYVTSQIGRDMIKNDMRVYTDSLLLNTTTLALIVIIYSIISGIQRKKQTPAN